MNQVVPLHPKRVGIEFPTIRIAAVAVDDVGRVWWEPSDIQDLWQVPIGSLVVDGTPGECASALTSERGLSTSAPRAIGTFREEATGSLIMAYRMQADADSAIGRWGLFFPLELAPLNSDPGHTAIVAVASGRKREWNERLTGPTGSDHVAILRQQETDPVSTTLSMPSFIDILRERIATSSGSARAKHTMRLGELLFLEGRLDRARSQLVEAADLANRTNDIPTRIRCELRLAELEDPSRAELAAWKWVSHLSAKERIHLDIPFAFLGSFAARRGRRREADVYLRRALALCEEPERRAALKRELILGSTARPQLSAIS